MTQDLNEARDVFVSTVRDLGGHTYTEQSGETRKIYGKLPNDAKLTLKLMGKSGTMDLSISVGERKSEELDSNIDVNDVRELRGARKWLEFKAQSGSKGHISKKKSGGYILDTTIEGRTALDRAKTDEVS